MMLSVWRYFAVFASIISFARHQCFAKTTPKVMVVTFFDGEGDVYLNNSNRTGALNFRARQHRVPFASPLFPYLHCTGDSDACLITVGEGMVNAATTIMALLADPMLDLRNTYWLLTGIAGGAPDQVTLNSIALARFAVQTSMQHEIDAREMPANFSTGYLPQGSRSPNDVWGGYVYNSEVFELNANLRDAAGAMINATQIVDTPEAKDYRANYAVNPQFEAGASPPTVNHCDVTTSDNWWSGTLLATSFAERVKLWTNGTGVYCATAQEDGAVLGALLRGTLEKRVDYGRIIVVRAVSNFDRPYPGQSAIDNLLRHSTTYQSALANVYFAGSSIAHGVIGGWEETYKKGVLAQNYLGDIRGSLGVEPDFGPGQDV